MYIALFIPFLTALLVCRSMTALCKNDLSSDLNSTFGFRFFANKPPRLALRVFSHAHKLLNFDGTRGSRCQAPMGDPREKKPSIPIHRKRGGRVYRFRTIWNLMELYAVYNRCLIRKKNNPDTNYTIDVEN